MKMVTVEITASEEELTAALLDKNTIMQRIRKLKGNLKELEEKYSSIQHKKAKAHSAGRSTKTYDAELASIRKRLLKGSRKGQELQEMLEQGNHTSKHISRKKPPKEKIITTKKAPKGK